MPRLRGLLGTLVQDGQPFNDAQIERVLPKIGLRHLLINGRKLLREGGRQSLVLLAIEDVTDRRRAVESSRQLAAIVDSTSDAIISIDAEGLINSWNAGAGKIFGFSAPEMIGKALAAMRDPAQVGKLPDCLAQFRDGASTLHYEMSRLRADGTPVWVSVTESPLRDHSGALLGASSIARDITNRRLAERHRDILVGELNHRVKNSLAIVQAIASQTLRGDVSLPDARSAFGARLRAMSRAHDLLVDANWTGSDLASVIHATIEPHQGEPSRFTVAGPYVALTPQIAVTFSLALHELSTNAAKYGALSVPEGRVDIAWTINGAADAPQLCWQWAETGGPPAKAPNRVGFGTGLIEKVLPMELFGKVRVSYLESGVVCVLDSPVPDVGPE